MCVYSWCRFNSNVLSLKGQIVVVGFQNRNGILCGCCTGCTDAEGCLYVYIESIEYVKWKSLQPLCINSE